MKSAEPGARILPWPRLAARRPNEREFLPAALEIVETPASPAGRAIAGTIILFFAVALVWACLGTVDIIATTQGRIIPSGKTKLIQPFETGVVRAIHVHDGDQVKAGDVLSAERLAGCDHPRQTTGQVRGKRALRRRE